MDIINISDSIQNKCGLLESVRKVIKERGDVRAETIATYDKVLAITLIRLKNGVELEIEGETIKNPPASTSEKLAKGICWESKLRMEKADADYKSAITNLNTIQAELSALQSIFRHLDRG